MGAGTLLVALVVAVMASRHVNRLQREIERQRRIEQQNREDLERLSARLVDVQEQERRALARELHDEVGQALTAVKMDIGIALRADIDSRVRNALEEARDISESTLRSVRDMSQLLHPSVLDDFGLPATLTTYLRNFSHRTGIRAQLAETMDARLAPEIEVCVYRIVQEALSNVAQHSGATTCTVPLSAGRRLCGSRSRTTAAGRDRRRAVSRLRRGLGLIGMRERAQALGGSFTVGDRAGGGTPRRRHAPAERHGCPERLARDWRPARRIVRMSMLRILLADDHTVVRQGLRKVLEERPDWQVVAEAGDGREAVRQAEELKPDVAILDVAMPLLNGIEATRQIVQARA